MLRRLSLLCIPALIVVGCTSSRSGASLDGMKGASLSQDEAIEMMRRVEREPLSADAPKLRKLAFEWVVSSPELGDISIDTHYLGDLESSTWPFKGEMMMQHIFGMALWKLTGDSLQNDQTAQIEAGLRSVLAAYKNMLLADAKLREPALDDLDEVRRRGKLRDYILEIDRRRP